MIFVLIWKSLKMCIEVFSPEGGAGGLSAGMAGMC